MTLNGLYLEVDHAEFEVFNCPDLGQISPKACNNCRQRSVNKCPLGKK